MEFPFFSISMFMLDFFLQILVLMMCDNPSLYSSYVPSAVSMSTSANNNTQFYSMENDNQCNEHRSYNNVKRKLSGMFSSHSIHRISSNTIQRSFETFTDKYSSIAEDF